MLWRSIAVVGLAAMLWTNSAQGQHESRASTGTDQAQSEISTLNTDAAIKVRVNLVLARVVVRDGAGKVVSGLTQDDFQVFDNGKRQKISAFNVETLATPAGAVTADGAGRIEEPKDNGGAAAMNPSAMSRRFVALVFDDLHMKAADAMAVRAATKKLFAGLTPTDRVAIYSTSGIVQQDFTADAETLRKTLAAVIPHPAKGESEFRCPNISYYQADLMVNKNDQEARMPQRKMQ